MKDLSEPDILPDEESPKTRGEHEVCAYGADPIVQNIKAIKAEITGVRQAKDKEHIHRMRVASRRLRAALAIFHDCLPAKRSLLWARDIRSLTRALGAARDTDVQIEVVREIYTVVAEKVNKPGIRRLLLRLKQQRKALQERVQKTLEQLEKSSSLENISSKFEHLISGGQTLPAKKDQLYRLAYETINDRLNEFLAYEVYIRRVEYKQELHAMRIAAKKLRYTMEIFNGLFPGEITNAIQAARKTQEWIGAIHDCDVWIEYIPRFLEKELTRMQKFYGHSGPSRYIEPGLEYFLKNRKEQRNKLYKDFLTCWQKWRRKEIWLTLREVILVKAMQSVEPPPPENPSSN